MGAEVVPFRDTRDEPRALPNNTEAEASLLGALLSDNRLFDSIADILTPADFFEPVHGRIYETALQETMAGRSASPVTLKGKLADDAALQSLPGYLARLTGAWDRVSNPVHLAKLIADLSRRREMLERLMAASEACHDQMVPLALVADQVMSAATDGPEDGAAELSIADCAERHLQIAAEGVAGTLCGRIPSFDRLIGPLRRQQLVLVAGRPGMGKTSLALSYAIGAAKQSHGVLFISLEMSADQVGGRAISDMCFGPEGEGAVPYAAIRDANLSERERRRVTGAIHELDKIPLMIVDAPSATPGALARRVRRHARRFEARGTPLQLVIVDYIQRMRPERQMQKKYEEVSEISAALKDIAKANDVPIMALAQLNREVERRPDKRPVLSDLRDSGQLEQDADTIVFLLRQEYYLAQVKPSPSSPKFIDWQGEMAEEEGKIEFILAKRRDGATGSARAEYHAEFQAVRG